MIYLELRRLGLYGLGLIFLVSCSSRRIDDGSTQKKEKTENVFSQALKNYPHSSLKERVIKNPYSLFRALNETQYKKNLKDLSRFSAMNFDNLVFIHGDFHPFQLASRNGAILIDDFDASDRGPWWYDLLRFESATLVLASQLGLRDYRAGSCYGGYKSYFQNKQKIIINESEFWPASQPAPKGTIPWGPHLENNWNAAESIALDEALRLKAQSYFDSSQNKILETKKSKTGIGSAGYEKYLVKTQDSATQTFRLFEIKEQPPTPFSITQGFESQCARINEWNNLFLKGSSIFCFDALGKTFIVNEYFENYKGLELESFKSQSQLENLSRSMCYELANFHATSIHNKPKAAEFKTAVVRNKLFESRILKYATDTALEIVEAHRQTLR